jgi:hypothetical protein
VSIELNLKIQIKPPASVHDSGAIAAWQESAMEFNEELRQYLAEHPFVVAHHSDLEDVSPELQEFRDEQQQERERAAILAVTTAQRDMFRSAVAVVEASRLMLLNCGCDTCRTTLTNISTAIDDIADSRG